MIVIASQMCEQEVGDGTNLVLILAGDYEINTLTSKLLAHKLQHNLE